MPPSLSQGGCFLFPGTTTRSFGHFSLTSIPAWIRIASAQAYPAERATQPKRSGVSPVPRTTVLKSRPWPRGECQRRPRRPRPAVCSSAVKVVPCGAPLRAAATASSFVDSVDVQCATLHSAAGPVNVAQNAFASVGELNRGAAMDLRSCNRNAPPASFNEARGPEARVRIYFRTSTITITARMTPMVAPITETRTMDVPSDVEAGPWYRPEVRRAAVSVCGRWIPERRGVLLGVVLRRSLREPGRVPLGVARFMPDLEPGRVPLGVARWRPDRDPSLGPDFEAGAAA